MTIKELENRTGMTRANIRFYEEEGLLAPKRLSNGYRNYSEEDARTLEKIRLLRQLQLDIDTIRKLQRGALTLDQALFTQLTRLEGDKALIERAAQVCRELERSGVEYATLEPQPWLTRLETAQRPSLPEPPPPEPEEEWPRACYHPWQRFFARTLDIALYDTLINVLWLAISRDRGFLRLQTGNVIASCLWGAAMLAITLALEPLWLHFWGWTPGKWLFGLKLRDKEGEKLSIERGWERSWQLAWEGYGWNIPFYDLWRFWNCRKEALDGWDGDWNHEHGCRYTKVERRISSAAAFVTARAALTVMLSVSMWWSALTPRRGPLTVAEFSRNYNHHYRQLNEFGGYDHLPTLDREGRWKEPSSDGGGTAIHGAATWVTSDGEIHTIEHTVEGTTVWDEPEYTLTDGYVTAVKLHMESGDSIVDTGTREALALLALTGSVDWQNPSRPEVQEAQGLLSEWKDRQVSCGGVRIVQQVEFEGYDASGPSGWLWSESGDGPQHCEKTVTISLAEP